MDALVAIGCQTDAEIRIDEAALNLAAADRTRADLQPALDWLAAMGAQLPRAVTSAEPRAESLSALLAGTEGLDGDRDDYDAARNADLLSVLARRRGLPIALAILYVGVARRAGWEARVLALPGHVLVAVEGDETLALIDPFAGGRVLAPAELAGLPSVMALGRSLRAGEAALMTNRETLVRLLMNPASRARQAGDNGRALTLYRRMTLIAPGKPELWWERARLERILGDTVAARRSLAAMHETTMDPGLRDRIREAYAAMTR